MHRPIVLLSFTRYGRYLTLRLCFGARHTAPTRVLSSRPRGLRLQLLDILNIHPPSLVYMLSDDRCRLRPWNHEVSSKFECLSQVAACLVCGATMKPGILPRTDNIAPADTWYHMVTESGIVRDWSLSCITDSCSVSLRAS